jgi:hypothetical protein
VEVHSYTRGDEVLAGELIAVRLDSLWVLTESGLRSRAMSSVHLVHTYTGIGANGQVVREDVQPVDEGAITRPNDASVARARVADLRPWARFPQGWPPDLDPAALRPKPVAKR